MTRIFNDKKCTQYQEYGWLNFFMTAIITLLITIEGNGIDQDKTVFMAVSSKYLKNTKSSIIGNSFKKNYYLFINFL